MAVNTGSFVDEINDQFLACRMCSDIYKTPKVLSCMHTFCEKCLEAHYEMEEQERPYRFLLYTRALSCPLCHSRTELPTGGVHRLPDNFLVANLADVVNRRKPSAKNPVCEICRPGSKKDETGTRNDADKNPAEEEKRAVAKCLDCVKMLCRTCAELHRRTRVTQQHGLFDIQVEKDTECKLHPNEIIRFYCDPCEECICVLCTFHDHKDHDVSSLLEALERHRGPFEELIGRCGDRVERLKEQVELIDRCERGLRLAEDHIRDSAIEAIAAIRRREKDLLAELRETLGEQSLEFIAEKETYKENLKNLEGTFQLTNAMLKGTSIDLLMVKKEMKDKLIAILDTGIKKTPETLKRNIQLCHEDYYQDIRTAAFSHVTQTDRLIGQKTKFGEGEALKRSVTLRSVGTETDMPVSLQSVKQTTDDFVDFDHRRDFSSGLDKSQQKMGGTENPEKEDQNQAAEDDDDFYDSNETQQNAVWQRPMAVVDVTEIPRTLGNIVLRPVVGGPRQADRTTQTKQAVLTDRWTTMPKITFSEKETSTPHVHVLHKNVSTDNQTMVEKSTNTVVDVTAAYRGASSTRRMVMVSRGTCTPRMMMLDKETLPMPSSSANRGCSPVTWTGNTVNAHAPTPRSDEGLPALTISEHHAAPQNVAVGGAKEDSTHMKSSLATAENSVSNQGSASASGDSIPTQIREVLSEATDTSQKSVANHGSHVAAQAGQVPHQKPITDLGESASGQGLVVVPNSKLHNQSIVRDQGNTAPKENPMANPEVQMPVQKPVASAGGNIVTQSPVAVTRGQGPVQRSAAIPSSNAANQGRLVAPGNKAPTQTPPTVPGGSVHSQSLVTISGGQIPAQRPVDIPGSSAVSQGSLGVPAVQVQTQKPAAAPAGNIGNQNTLVASGGQATVQRPVAIPGNNVINQIPVANPGSQIPAPRPMTVQVNNVASQNYGSNPGSQMPTPRPTTVPGNNVVNQIPVANPGSQIQAPRPITVPRNSVVSQNAVAGPGSQTPAPKLMTVQGSNVASQTSVANPGNQIPAPRLMTVPGSNVSIKTLPAVSGGQVPARAPNTVMAGYVANQSRETVSGANISGQGQTPGNQTSSAQRNTTVVNQNPVTIVGCQTPKQTPISAAPGDMAKQVPSQMAVQKPLTVPGGNGSKQGISTAMKDQSPNDRHEAVPEGNTGNEIPSQRPTAMKGETPNQRAIGNTLHQSPVAIQEGKASIQPSVNAPVPISITKPGESTPLTKPGDPMSEDGNVVSNADGAQPQLPMTLRRGQSSAVNSNTAAPNVLGKTVSTLLSAIFPSSAAKQVSNGLIPERP